jgi:hypothetical protein
MSYRRDINDDNDWSEMEIADLRNHVAQGQIKEGRAGSPLISHRASVRRLNPAVVRSGSWRGLRVCPETSSGIAELSEHEAN